jgi:hypothetical protein
LAALLAEELRSTPLPAANGNFKLRPDCEAVLIAWMHDNLLVAFTPWPDPQAIEKRLIAGFAAAQPPRLPSVARP